MQKAKLENWQVGTDDCLIGESYGHPKHKDGTIVITSRVVTWDKESGKAITANTEYELGKPLNIEGR